MELRELRCFVAACELHSVSAAARRVGRVQPAVSNALGRLETELGVRLLRRHPGGVEPTPAGLTFLRHAQTVLAAVDRAADEMATLRTSGAPGGRPSGDVRLGVAAPAAPEVLMALLREVSRAAAGVEVHVTERRADAALDALETGELDLGLLWLPVRRKTLEVQALRAFPLVALAARDRLPALLEAVGGDEAAAPACPLGALADEPWIAFPAGTVPRLWLDSACLRAGIAPRVVREVRTWTECRAALTAGLGLALLPEVCAAPDTAAGSLRAATVGGAGHALLGVVHASRPATTAAEEIVRTALARVTTDATPAGVPERALAAVPA